jgi:hypothetical protein
MHWTDAATVLVIRTLVVGPGQETSVRYPSCHATAMSGMRAGGSQRAGVVHLMLAQCQTAIRWRGHAHRRADRIARAG